MAASEEKNKSNCETVRALLISGIGISLDEGDGVALDEAKRVLSRLGIRDSAELSVYKRSVDARVRGGVHSVRRVLAVRARFHEPIRLSERQRALLPKLSARAITEDEEPTVVYGDTPIGDRPLVVGMGPAGLFAALMLAENGYRPILIDRGDDVRTRVRINDSFMETGVLDTESNVQFGAGGAGTFSDGKLITRINDPSISYVLRRFVDCGAPEEILSDARPHIGTDLLVGVVERLIERIAEKGGTVLYRTRLTGIRRERDEERLVAETSAGEISCGALVLALGHSARDTQRMLMRLGLPTVPKAFSVGVRVEHLQKEIDKALYGDYAGHPALGHAEYNLSDTTGDRGVYTFCMCPGGTVMAAASEEGGVVVNGMSRHARDGENAVAAVAVSVMPEDCGGGAEDGFLFQRMLEERAFKMGGGAYAAPIQTLGDFMDGALSESPTSVTPTYSRGVTRLSRVDTLFPDRITDTLRAGFRSFGRKVRGYDAREAILTGVETRTSSPVRIMRTEELTAVGFPLIYPIGEGAGYAGGITSAAVDGIRAALAIMKRFRVSEDL